MSQRLEARLKACATGREITQSFCLCSSSVLKDSSNTLLTMDDPDGKKAAAAELTESLLNPDMEEQVIVDEELSRTWTMGEKQPSRFRDAPFAILFFAQLFVVLGLAIGWGFSALKYKGGDSEPIEFSGILYICLISGLVTVAVSALALSFMTRFAHYLVQFSVLFSVFCWLLMVIIFGFQDRDGAALVAFIFFALSAWYAWAIWNRIPFAASNLATALTAVRSNLGVALVAYGLVLVAVTWTLVWIISLIGIYVRSADCHEGMCEGHINSGVAIFFLLSLYWTQQVIKNMIHVTVSGVVGTWWFDPADAHSLCSKAIFDSFVRSATFSFGSVCFGSLLVAVIQVFRHLVENARAHGTRGIAMCILDCLLEYVERLVVYFNKWAYVYVGLYGYSYMEAGHKVMSLFSERGWSAIINDDLLINVLSLMSLVIGCLTGCVGLAMAAAHKSWVSEFPDKDSLWVPFLAAFLIGYLISSILMSVVASAVDTVVVCFAESPNEFQTNYPQLSEQMVQAWRRTYPQEFICARGAPALHDDTVGYFAPVGHAQELQPALNTSDPLAPQDAFC